MISTMPASMTQRLNSGRRCLPVVAITMAILVPVSAASQAAMAKPERMEFEVASVERNKAEPAQENPPYSNFPLGPGDAYTKTGGLFVARNMQLIAYIQFAFKVMPNQAQSLQAHLPSWVNSERFDIVARAEGDPTKDQMRLMIRSVLEERFRMVWRRETQEVSVLALTMVKPGVFGPMLLPHPADAVCSIWFATPKGADIGPPPPPTTPDGKFPTVCGGLVGIPSSKPGSSRIGGRDVSMALIASTLKFIGNLDRPVLDQTGLKGTYDFSLECTRESMSAPAPGENAVQEDAGSTFLQALREQMGLKLQSTKGPLETVVIDHIEQPSEN
jgi:uncharacterized protein (TIGR03435 family)